MSLERKAISVFCAGDEPAPPPPFLCTYERDGQPWESYILPLSGRYHAQTLAGLGARVMPIPCLPWLRCDLPAGRVTPGLLEDLRRAYDKAVQP